MGQIAEKKRLNYIDDAKAFAILLMIIGHLATDNVVDVLIYGFYIPLFFIVSGLFFNPNRSLKVNISKAFKQLVVPYICFEIINLSICWISPTMHPELYHGMKGLGIFKAAIMGILLGQDYVTNFSFLPMGTLWFLMALFWVRIIFAAISKVLKNKFLLSAAVSVLGIGFYFVWSENVLPIEKEWINIFSIRSAAMGLPFYAVGYLMSCIDFTRLKYRPLVMTLLAFFYVISALYNGICGIDELSYGKNIVLYYLNAIMGTMAVILFFSLVEMPEYVHDVGRNTLLILGLSFFPVIVYKSIEMLIFHQSYIANYYVYIPLSLVCIAVIMPLRKFFEKYLPFALGR